MPSGTVKLNEGTKVRLRSLKIHPRETYDDVICRLVEMAIDREPVDADLAEQLGESDADVAAGRLVDFDEVCDDLGL
ncbi:MAG: hypothetical protein GXY82_01230 [Methanospirillum sp.]|nr:hypothetical protein [Methanospirillum sp.]